MNNQPLHVPVLSNQTIAISFCFLSPGTVVEGPLFVNPALERLQPIGGQQTTLPLHDGHMELQPCEGHDTSVCFYERVQGSADHVTLSLGPEVIDLLSEERVLGAPVKNRKRLGRLVGRPLPCAAFSLLRFWHVFLYFPWLSPKRPSTSPKTDQLQTRSFHHTLFPFSYDSYSFMLISLILSRHLNRRVLKIYL